MTEQSRGPKGDSARTATSDGSRQERSRATAAIASFRGSDRVGRVVLVLGLAAGVALFASLISTVAAVDVADGSCRVIYDSSPDLAKGCSLSGYERHSIAFVLLGLLALAMAFGAGPARSRGAALALVVVGGIAVLIALLSDLPITDDTGAIGRDFEGATASAGTGLWLELMGGVLAIAAGALRLLAPEPAKSGHGESGDPRRARRHGKHAKHERPTDVARADRRAGRVGARERTAE